MIRIDLDDLPPKAAALLMSLGEGEEAVLVQSGAVVGRLVGGAAPKSEPPEPEASPEERVREVFETFRSAIEDEF